MEGVRGIIIGWSLFIYSVRKNYFKKKLCAGIITSTNKNYLKAADINKDGKINSGDSLTAKQHIMGVKKIVLK